MSTPQQISEELEDLANCLLDLSEKICKHTEISNLDDLSAQMSLQVQHAAKLRQQIEKLRFQEAVKATDGKSGDKKVIRLFV